MYENKIILVLRDEDTILGYGYKGDVTYNSMDNQVIEEVAEDSKWLSRRKFELYWDIDKAIVRVKTKNEIDEYLLNKKRDQNNQRAIELQIQLDTMQKLNEKGFNIDTSKIEEEIETLKGV